MKKFKVTASYVSYCHAEIFAQDAEEARMLARDMDGGQFIPADRDDWNIETVDEVPFELTEEQKAFIDSFESSVGDVERHVLVDFFNMDGDSFCGYYGTSQYTPIADARMVWLEALNYADKKVIA